MRKSSLQKKLIELIHEEAVETGLVTRGTSDTLLSMTGMASRHPRRHQERGEESDFSALLAQMARLHENAYGELSIVGLAPLLALDDIAVNATDNAFTSKESPTLRQRIESLIDRGLVQDNGRTLEKGMATLVMSLVQTMHPTIYHSKHGQIFERRLTQILEDHLDSAAPEAAMLQSMRGEIRSFMKAYINGEKTITPTRPVTTAEESNLEKKNFTFIRERMHDIMNVWNEVAHEKNAPHLAISPEKRKRMVEYRTWARSADADGREKATSMELFMEIRKAWDEADPAAHITFDARQNAKLYELLLSALIQRRYRDAREGLRPGDNFDRVCEDFMAQRRHEVYTHPSWKSAASSTYEQLSPRGQTEFARLLLHEGYALVPDFVKRHVKPLLGRYEAIYQSILSEFKDEIAAHGLSRSQMSAERMKGVIITCEDGGRAHLYDFFLARLQENGIQLSPNGLGFQEVPDSRNSESLNCSKLLKDRKKLDPTANPPGTVPLSTDERILLMDNVRRLVVLNNMIDEYGPQVATRHQIANFSSPADFYTMLKLFEEVGLASIDRQHTAASTQAQVTQVKMGIQPLIETLDDMRHAPEIFRTLLQDPLVVSYFKTRGKTLGMEGGCAEIMLGFSDGAASGGNVASLWNIHKTSRELTAIFAEHGIALHILQGRGRGTDRGGMIDPSLIVSTMPPEIYTSTGRLDVTIQSDLPMDLGNSKHYGEEYLGKFFLAGIESQTHPIPLSPDMAALEPALDWIAVRAGEIYNEKVRKHPEALRFLNAVPDNPHRNSRAAGRGAASRYEDFDKVRAITKEMAFNQAGLPVYNVGLAAALNELQHMSPAGLADTGIVIEDNGRHLSGSEVMARLPRHPFYAGLMKTVEAGMRRFDPTVARHYGEMAKTPGFVCDTIKDLSELSAFYPRAKDLFQAQTPSRRAEWGEKLQGTSRNDVIDYRSTFGKIAQAGIVAASNAGIAMKPDRSVQRKQAEFLDMLLFIVGQEPGRGWIAPERGQVHSL